MLRRLLNVVKGFGVLTKLVEFIVRFSTRQWRNSREIRNLIQKIDAEISNNKFILQTQRATELKEDPLNYVDIGSRGGPQKITEGFLKIIHFVICEADKDEVKNLESTFDGCQFSVISNAISDSDTTRTLYLTASRGASSLLKPTGNAIGLFGGNERNLDRFKIEQEIQIKTLPLSMSMPPEIKTIDILKIDVQGLEFEILSGMGDFRPFLICAECSTVEMYSDQKTLFSVGLLLEKLGYMPIKLMEITVMPKTRANFQSCIQIHGDVIFVPNNSPSGKAIIERDVEKWFASLCMHGYMDFALWQIEELKIPKPPLVKQTEELLKIVSG